MILFAESNMYLGIPTYVFDVEKSIIGKGIRKDRSDDMSVLLLLVC